MWQAIGWHLRAGEGKWLLALLALVPVNWALESLKWQMLVSKVQAISFFDALCSTLAGLLSGLALPAQVGDVIGRVAALNMADRARAIGAALVSGGIQFYAAVFGGLWGVVFLWTKLPLRDTSLILLTVLLSLVLLGGVVFFMLRGWLIFKIPDSAWGMKVRAWLEVIGAYRSRELLSAFGVGVARYLTYLGQFVAGLLLFQFKLSVPEMIACVALILMIKTVMPALNLLGDLGLRGVSAVFIFGGFGMLPGEVLAVTLLIWITNILFPALFGLLLIWLRSWRYT